MQQVEMGKWRAALFAALCFVAATVDLHAQPKPRYAYPVDSLLSIPRCAEDTVDIIVAAEADVMCDKLVDIVPQLGRYLLMTADGSMSRDLLLFYPGSSFGPLRPEEKTEPAFEACGLDYAEDVSEYAPQWAYGDSRVVDVIFTKHAKQAVVSQKVRIHIGSGSNARYYILYKLMRLRCVVRHIGLTAVAPSEVGIVTDINGVQEPCLTDLFLVRHVLRVEPVAP